MKKLLSLFLILMLVFSMTACSSNAGDPVSEPAEEPVSTVEESSQPEEAAQPPEDEPEEDTDLEEESEDTEESQVEIQQTAAAEPEPQQDDETASTGKTLVVYISHTNTTATVAGHITGAIEADVFEIVPVNAYPIDYNQHLDVAQQELSDDVRPAITSGVSNMDDYDTILIGYPIWWGYAPRPVITFLESHDLSGKTIAPFCTSGSSGMGQSASEIARLAPGADVVSGLSITSSNTGNAQSLVRDWLSGLGLL